MIRPPPRSPLFPYTPLSRSSRALLGAGPNFHAPAREPRGARPPFRADRRRNNHAVGLDAAQFARREIHNHGNLAANEFFRFVILRDARANLPNLRADIYGKFQQLIRADDAFRRFDLPDAHLDFRKILDADFLRRGPGRRSRSRLSRTGSSFRSEEHTSELQSRLHLVCRLLLAKKQTIPPCRRRSKASPRPR